LKFCSYFPYNAKLCLNGHEWAKRQAAQAGIVHTALDNGFATCDDPAAVQAICDRLGPDDIDGLLRKWLAILPHPFTAADRDAGYRYDISVRQVEFSLTQVLDRPISGGVVFEHVIRDNLDAGRPDQVCLIFNRRVRRDTPGTIRAAEAFTAVHDPIVTDTGHRIAGLRLGDRRAHALLQALLMFRLLPNGFRNHDLRSLLAQLLGRDT